MKNFRKTLSAKFEKKKQELKKKLEDRKASIQKRKEMERAFYAQAKQEVELAKQAATVERMKAKAVAKAQAGGSLRYYGGMIASGMAKGSRAMGSAVAKAQASQASRPARQPRQQEEQKPMLDILGTGSRKPLNLLGSGKPMNILGSGKGYDILGSGNRRRRQRLI